METTLTTKGQVTIPKLVRDQLGLSPGSKVTIEADGEGGARIVPAKPRPEGFARFRGIGRLPGGMTPDEYMTLMRDDVDA